MKASRYSFFTLTCWSLAACGGLVAIGNLLGITGTGIPIFPPVDSLAGLIATSLFLFALGMLPMLLSARPRASEDHR